MSDEVLPLDEIVRRYPRVWVLLGDLVDTGQPDIQAGRVLFHSTDRWAITHEMLRIRKNRFERFAVAHTGELAGDPVVVL